MSPTAAASRSPSWPLVGIFLILLITALKIASALALPIVVALLLALLLSSPVRWLRTQRIPEPVGAAILVFGSVLVLGTGIWFLSAPAAGWIEDAPGNLEKVELKLKRLASSLRSIRETAEKVEDVTSSVDPTKGPVVQIAQPGTLQRVWTGGARLVGAALSVVFLSYFLLAAAPRFRSKLATVLPHRPERRQVEEVIQEIEAQMSRYLLLSTLINLVVGLLTWALLALLGFPNPALWGALAGIANYVPYLGALVTFVAIAFAGLVAFDGIKLALVGSFGFFVINMLETNLFTPLLLGKKLPLNPAALFLGLLVFGWLWGITGAVLAVPLTVMIQVVCARIEELEPIAIFLDS
jgi:predicted PurR-regulated permease PerM